MNRTQDTQADDWDSLYRAVTRLLARHGVEESTGKGDYLVVDDNYGWLRSQVEIHNLKMLRPQIVAELRELLTDMPDWEITISVHIPGKDKVWPIMGLTIRKNEIIDGLQRRYFPKEFQDLKYADSRIGTGYD